MYTVTSEIYKETNFQPVKSTNGKVVSKFQFRYPNDEVSSTTTCAMLDEDGDLAVKRKKIPNFDLDIIEIEHSEATELRLVGLQVWRGALLLADFCFHKRHEFVNKQILELGAGVGLTSIAAAIYVPKVVCTDVNIGGILNVIKANISRNQKLLKTRGQINVLECDFKTPFEQYSQELIKAIDESDVVVAADVIYDDDLTDAFIQILDNIFAREIVTRRKKNIYIALEKRYVFTVSELEAVAPMFEYFLKKSMNKKWRFEYIHTDFPQYFQYERCEHLILLQITNSS
uniref:Methyltransferase-like protein 22 n=1 Tax=Glossina brevipalpis TaxID=37001 RepID=A0A1A9X0M8_9MUSC